MKFLFSILAIVISTPALAHVPGPGSYKYELKSITEVDGRQGVAANGTHYFLSGSTNLIIYDKNWKKLKENTDPLSALPKYSNHIGDIAANGDEIIAGVEYFMDGKAQDIQIAVYDADTLEYKRAFPYNPESGQVEVSAIAVDVPNRLVWMTSWIHGNYIYRYSLDDGKYMGKVHLLPSPQWPQGITVYKNRVFFTADDGNADRKEYDNLWSINSYANGQIDYVLHEHAFKGFLDYGEIEGLDFDEEDDELLVLHNRGKQIVLGMPKGLYPGYDRAISEIYTYKVIPNDDGKMHSDLYDSHDSMPSKKSTENSPSSPSKKSTESSPSSPSKKFTESSPSSPSKKSTLRSATESSPSKKSTESSPSSSSRKE